MAKYSSHGTKLQMDIASVFTDCVGVRNLDYPDSEIQYWDATDLASADVEDGEPTGLNTPGTVSGELIWDPANTVHAAMLAAHAAQTKTDFKLIASDSGAMECAFEATVQRFQPKAARGEGLLVDFALKLTAPATFTP